MVRATEVLLRFVGTYRTLRCTHIVHTLTRQVFLGGCNEVWAHRLPSPHLVPFSSFPPHTFLFLLTFFSCLPLLHVLSSHSFRSFARTTVRALVCTRTSTSNSGFRSPGFRQRGFIGCPCAFGFSFIATTHTFVPSRLPSHVFILLSLLRAQSHIRPSLNFASPRGSVCVCAPCNHRDSVELFLPFSAGGPSMCCERWSNEAATVHADITADHRDVPAILERLNVLVKG